MRHPKSVDDDNVCSKNLRKNSLSLGASHWSRPPSHRVRRMQRVWSFCVLGDFNSAQCYHSLLLLSSVVTLPVVFSATEMMSVSNISLFQGGTACIEYIDFRYFSLLLMGGMCSIVFLMIYSCLLCFAFP